MGKTKKDILRGKYRRSLNNNIYELWDKLSELEKRMIWRPYSKNPSWHNRTCNRVPKRRYDRDLIKKVLKDHTQDYIFTLDKKPNKYFW